MLKLLEAFSHIIKKYDISSFDVESQSIRLKMLITFTDNSVLFVKDYIFRGIRRKYAYHWQDKKGSLRIRWDNAEHWLKIRTFPHHKHIGRSNQVSASTQTQMKEILEEIEKHLSKHSHP